MVLYRQWFWCCLFFVFFVIAHRRALIMICSVSCLISSPGVSLCHGLLSVVRPSLAFHIFDISSRTVSWIELKLSGRHCGNMEIQNC